MFSHPSCFRAYYVSNHNMSICNRIMFQNQFKTQELYFKYFKWQYKLYFKVILFKCTITIPQM